MRFVPTALRGAWVIEIDKHEDERGFFARTFCRDEFAARGLHASFVQSNISFNARRGTLRGMHYQIEPHAEAKLVCCTRGLMYDVIIDLRPDSETYTRWISVELDAEAHTLLYVPEGFAHGFQVLVDNTAVSYQMGAIFNPDAARGVRWNDPFFGIRWPLPNPVISKRDTAYADFVPFRRMAW